MADEVKVLLHDEVQLLDWGESRGTGPWVKFRLNDPDLLDVFRGMDTATATKTGHILHVTVAEGDIAAEAHEQEEQHGRKGGALARLAGMLCQSEEFMQFLREHRGEKASTPEEARAVILRECEISSRRYLDYNQQAAERFHRMFRLPFTKWREAA